MKTYFYNTPQYIAASASTSPLLYTEYEADGHTIQAKFWLFVHDNIGCSPMKAPFGSVEFSEDMGDAELQDFIQDIVADARAKKLEKIRIASYPDCYHYEQSLRLHKALLANGFKICYSDLNYHFPVDEKIIFKHLLHRGERWKLNKSKRVGLEFHQVHQPDLDYWYDFISHSRQRKNYEMSLSRADFIHQLCSNRDRYKFFGVYDDARLVALAVTVLVNDDILYTFYTADHLAYRKWSPVVMLHEGIYIYCQDEGYKILDLGTASKHGVINEGVSIFKSSLGAIPSYKHTFEITL